MSVSLLNYILLALLAIACSCGFYLWFKLKSTVNRNNQLQADHKALESKVSQIELESLNYKINPHLFKNILNSIQSHAYQTYFSLDKLSNVLDYILYETGKPFVSVKEELEFAKNLIEINKLKLSPLFDITVKYKVDEQHPLYEQPLLMSMISADLIENAFKHADMQSSDAFISITFELKDGFFALTVANKKSAKAPLHKDHSGLGRQSLQKRLGIVYKDCHSLQQFEENQVFISHLKLNLLDYKAKVLAAG